ncbi:serine/threonine protein kinase [Schlegelella sp. S2-27]|uniref:Serine/threonine protein kinase n=1 Tax=Caldimonas mangrovi TaxID=2944811 RepID=A0ABT0YTP3_9BURK|nr:serine/threonine-protein kinase [Caldimonas mangrovi]MCM5682003.1 serine/threonine protein kinase [Caldimonas mangrovi]
MKHPERLGKYPITGVLGEGAMGVVYKAFDPHIKRQVAIKTIRRQLIDDSEHGQSVAARFRNEAQAAGRLLHPGIVAVYEYGEDQDQAFIAMEFVEGNSLSHYLSRKTRFPDQDVLSIMTQLLAALDHAHEQGVWHRDIKPANLIITRQGRLKIADFGIARVDAIGLTQVNSVVGTPGYMSPEQYTGQPLDHRVDVWAAGVLLYQLLTGQLPFNGSAETLMYKIVHEEPVWPSQHAGSTRPVVYDQIVATALAKRPEARYANALLFLEALTSHADEPVKPTVSEETVIMEVMRPEPRGAGSVSSAVRSGSSGAVTTAPPTHWDASTLSHLEATLAKYVGPVAKVLVRRAARDCFDIETLASRLAEHLPTEPERAAFMQHTTSGVSVRAQRSTGGTATVLSTHLRLDAQVIEQAQRILAGHIGPIAKIVTKKAAAKATTRAEFYELLCAELGSDADRTKARAALAGIK